MSSKTNSKRRQAFDKLSVKIQDKKLNLKDALVALREFPSTKFDQAIELVAHLGIDTKQADQNIRSTMTIPHGTGKKIIVAVIADGDMAAEAKEAGADIIGDEQLLHDIKNNKVESFDKLIAQQKWMKDFAKMGLGRVLGPKGLMPNPKDGTVLSSGMKETVSNIKKGKQISFRAEKDGGIVHVTAGRLSFADQDLIENIQVIINTLQKIKPASCKGAYFKSLYIKSTMSGSIQLDLSSILTS